MISDDADLDAGPAGVELEPGVAVAEFAAAVDFAVPAAGRVRVGGFQLGDGQVDARVGDVEAGGEGLADALVGPGMVVVVPVGVQQLLRGGQAAGPGVVGDPGVLGRVLALELADGLRVAGAGVD